MVALKADEAILACTAGITSGAREFVSEKPINVMDLDEILTLQKTGS